MDALVMRQYDSNELPATPEVSVFNDHDIPGNIINPVIMFNLSHNRPGII